MTKSKRECDGEIWGYAGSKRVIDKKKDKEIKQRSGSEFSSSRFKMRSHMTGSMQLTTISVSPTKNDSRRINLPFHNLYF